MRACFEYVSVYYFTLCSYILHFVCSLHRLTGFHHRLVDYCTVVQPPDSGGNSRNGYTWWRFLHAHINPENKATLCVPCLLAGTSGDCTGGGGRGGTYPQTEQTVGIHILHAITSALPSATHEALERLELCSDQRDGLRWSMEWLFSALLPNVAKDTFTYPTRAKAMNTLVQFVLVLDPRTWCACASSLRSHKHSFFRSCLKTDFDICFQNTTTLLEPY